MRKVLKTCILILLLILPFGLNVSAAAKMDLNQLIENAKALDGKQVTVQGETIGEIMVRGDYSWVNINDGTNAMGIWLKTPDAQKVTSYGNYKSKGDTIRITGIFRRACAEHGGEADIHSDTMEIVTKGSPVKEQIPVGKLVAVVLLAPTAGILYLLYLKKMKETAAEQ